MELVERFGSVRTVFNPDKHSFAGVSKIGEKKAAEIVKVVTAKCEGRERRMGE